jgi:tRNA pseudouridine38-40 synthase
MRFALKFAYDGREFHGYARQPKLRTIEGELIKALIKYGIIEDTNESSFRSGSRTDKGVSSLGNVVAFNTNFSKLEILGNLSKEFTDIVAYGISDVDSKFFPRYARFRHYRYYLKNKSLDFDKIVSTASCFTGEHDFSNFARVESFKDPVRVMDNIVVDSQDDLLFIDFFGQTFLWNQIRRIVSVLIKAGHNEIEKSKVVEALANPYKHVDFGLAPSDPLILMDVVYDFDFECDKDLLKKAMYIEKDIISSI